MSLIDEYEEKELKEILRNFIDRKCIFRCDPEVQYSPGIPKGTIPGAKASGPMKFQFFMRNISHDSDMVTAACILFVDMMQKNGNFYDDFQLAGLETSSTPLIAHLQSYIRRNGRAINAFNIRKNRKNYGLFNFLDGIPNKNRFVVVDDLINSASSLNRVLDTSLYELDLDPYPEAYFLININKQNTHYPWNGTTIRINSLFSKDDFNFDFDKSKYWLPFDCDKSFNKRPDYV